MNKVLLAIGEDTITNSIRNHLTNHGFEISRNEVLHTDYLEESIENYSPDIVIIHDTYLQNNFDTEFDKEDWTIRILQKFRYQYDDNLRVVYLCERQDHDPFLSRLIAVNVLDIFNKRTIDIEMFIKQLKAKARYSNVTRLAQSKYMSVDTFEGDTDVQENLENEVFNEEEQNKSPDNEEIESESSKKIEINLPRRENKKVVVKERVREKVIVQEKIVHSTSVVVGVMSLTMKAGSSLLTMMLAKALSEKKIKISVVDDPRHYPGRSYIYDFLGLHMHFDDYKSLPHLIYNGDESITRHTVPNQVHDGIRWLVTDTQKDRLDNWDVIDSIEMLRYIPSNVTLVDLGYYDLDMASKLLRYLDHIFFVTEITPQELEANDNRIQYVLEQKDSLKYSVILNNWDKSVGKQEIREIFDLKTSITCPPLDKTEIYKKTYAGKNPYDSKIIRGNVITTLQQMAQQIVPNVSMSKSSRRNVFPYTERFRARGGNGTEKNN